jgi:hypothetical protein
MKSVVVILLLSVSGIEEIKLKHNGNCEAIAENWRQVNTTYKDAPNQGNYTSAGKLLVGHICY